MGGGDFGGGRGGKLGGDGGDEGGGIGGVTVATVTARLASEMPSEVLRLVVTSDVGGLSGVGSALPSAGVLVTSAVKDKVAFSRTAPAELTFALSSALSMVVGCTDAASTGEVLLSDADDV